MVQDMRKKSFIGLLVVAMALTLVGCNRFRPRSFHHEQMEQVRMPVDTAQKNDFKEEMEDKSWEDEPLLEIPDIPQERPIRPDASGAERMFKEGY